MSDLVIKGIDQSTGRMRRVTASDTAVKTDLSTIVSDRIGAPNGIAALDALTLVVQDPASAVTTVTNDAIVKRTASGAILVSTLEAPGATAISLSTNSVEHVRINSTGQLMVGPSGMLANATPNAAIYRLNVGQDATTAISVFSSGAAAIPTFNTLHSRGTLASPTETNSADQIGAFAFVGSATAGYITGASIRAFATATWGAPNTQAAELSFYTANAGTEASRWSIRSTGALRGMSAGSSIDWTTGLGAITHVLGPADQNLLVNAGTRVGAGNGYWTLLRGGTPADGDGGWVDLLAANGVGVSRIGGYFRAQGGTGTNTQHGGLAQVFAGQGGPTNGPGGWLDLGGGLGGTNAAAGGSIDLYTAAAGTGLTRELRWRVGAPGHLVAGTDNTYDIGVTGATRPRTIYVRTSFVAEGGANALTIGDGSVSQSAGGLTITSTGGLLDLRTTTNQLVTVSPNSTTILEIHGSGIVRPALNNSYDLGEGAKEFRAVYVRTVTSNGSLLTLDGGIGGVIVNASGVGEVTLRTTDTARWRVLAAGELVAGADNTYDIGVAGATRPRSIYVRTSFIAEGATNGLTMSDGSITQSAGGLTVTSTAAALTLAATGANTVDVHTNGSARLTVADATVTVADALDFVFNTTTGTKFGTAAGQKLGWWNASPVVQQAVAALTNNITAGGTDDTLDNYTDLTTYATDASAIRNNLYQLGRKLDQVVDALRLYGLLG